VKEKDPDDEVMAEMVRRGSMPSGTVVEAPHYSPLPALSAGG